MQFERLCARELFAVAVSAGAFLDDGVVGSSLYYGPEFVEVGLHGRGEDSAILRFDRFDLSVATPREIKLPTDAVDFIVREIDSEGAWIEANDAVWRVDERTIDLIAERAVLLDVEGDTLLLDIEGVTHVVKGVEQVLVMGSTSCFYAYGLSSNAAFVFGDDGMPQAISLEVDPLRLGSSITAESPEFLNPELGFLGQYVASYAENGEEIGIFEYLDVNETEAVLHLARAVMATGDYLGSIGSSLGLPVTSDNGAILIPTLEGMDIYASSEELARLLGIETAQRTPLADVLTDSDIEEVFGLVALDTDGRSYFSVLLDVLDSDLQWRQYVFALSDPAPWQNATIVEDVNNDGYVSPLDALVVINVLNREGVKHLNTIRDTSWVSGPPYADTNGDNWVTPLDALLVINFLNRRSLNP